MEMRIVKMKAQKKGELGPMQGNLAYYSAGWATKA